MSSTFSNPASESFCLTFSAQSSTSFLYLGSALTEGMRSNSKSSLMNRSLLDSMYVLVSFIAFGFENKMKMEDGLQICNNYGAGNKTLLIIISKCWLPRHNDFSNVQPKALLLCLNYIEREGFRG